MGALRHSLGGRSDWLKTVEGPVRRLEILAILVCRLVLLPDPVGNPVAARIHAGHQAYARRRAEGVRIRIRKRHALGGQFLHVRRPVALVQESLDRLALFIRPERHGRILPSHVIHQENNDIGLFSGNGMGGILGRRPCKQGEYAAGGGEETDCELHDFLVNNVRTNLSILKYASCVSGLSFFPEKGIDPLKGPETPDVAGV